MERYFNPGMFVNQNYSQMLPENYGVYPGIL